MADAKKPRRGRQGATRRDPAFIEQYKVFVQSADNASGRRVSVNRYQTSLNVGIVALYGLAPAIVPQPAVPVIVAVAGFAISLNWLFTIRSLRRLNAEKFKIIQSMETELPRAVYTEEWQGLGRSLGQEKKWRYRGAHFFETQIPLVFAVLHLGAAAYAIFWWAR